MIFIAGSVKAQPIIVDHNAAAQFESIPQSVINDIQFDFNVFYGHTSHGSQIITGIGMISAEYPNYTAPIIAEYPGDLGSYGDLSWVQPTRDWLNANPDYNLVMWSWCGGVSVSSEAEIDAYLDAMNLLELDYPGVTFVYMTGHLDGTGPSGNLYLRNNQIRAYCLANNKILFDFADIESYDPDGNYYPDDSDYCYWCYDWCAANICPDCSGCAHSHCLNCYLKGKAWWWMMARIEGWSPYDAPTLSQWGSLIFGLLLLALGTIAIIQRRPSARRDPA